MGDAEILVIILIGIIVAHVFYLINLQKLLTAIALHNRKMEPNQVWMVFIPCFGLVWQFIMINRIADSLKAELDERHIPHTEERPGFVLGIAYCSLTCAAIIPELGALPALAGLVCWILYWVKMSEFTKILGGVAKTNDEILD
jgi:hypothetical protein